MYYQPSSLSDDLALSQKLAEELKFEQESAAEDAFSPAFLQSFKEEGIWTVCPSSIFCTHASYLNPTCSRLRKLLATTRLPSSANLATSSKLSFPRVAFYIFRALSFFSLYLQDPSAVFYRRH